MFLSKKTLFLSKAQYVATLNRNEKVSELFRITRQYSSYTTYNIHTDQI